eukprot:1832523-Prymnesium_polylepis.1
MTNGRRPHNRNRLNRRRRDCGLAKLRARKGKATPPLTRRSVLRTRVRCSPFSSRDGASPSAPRASTAAEARQLSERFCCIWAIVSESAPVSIVRSGIRND